ncbi:hypothetical protein Lpp189_01922 [Lacticaseibacillus paracasei subsp. paracasei Lpp189]|nr:hypothetical protein Lpp189_01922 [Lacticaseibacillus paracasei subsp. paracasei Lpp189]
MTTFKRILKRTLMYTLLVLGLAILMTFGYVGYRDVTGGKGYLAMRYLILTLESVVGGVFPVSYCGELGYVERTPQAVSVSSSQKSKIVVKGTWLKVLCRAKLRNLRPAGVATRS